MSLTGRALAEFDSDDLERAAARTDDAAVSLWLMVLGCRMAKSESMRAKKIGSAVMALSLLWDDDSDAAGQLLDDMAFPGRDYAEVVIAKSRAVDEAEAILKAAGSGHGAVSDDPQ